MIHVIYELGNVFHFLYSVQYTLQVIIDAVRILGNNVKNEPSRHGISQKFDADTVWCHSTSISIPFDGPALITVRLPATSRLYGLR